MILPQMLYRDGVGRIVRTEAEYDAAVADGYASAHAAAEVVPDAVETPEPRKRGRPRKVH